MKLRIRKASANSGTHGMAPLAPIVSAALPPVAVVPPVSGPVPAPDLRGGAPGSPAAVAASAVEEGLHLLKSPIVGTFYRARDPNSPPFVQVGDRVKAGQVLCIIEAMKMMNEIESEVAGEIVRVLPENGQPVQHGEPL